MMCHKKKVLPPFELSLHHHYHDVHIFRNGPTGSLCVTLRGEVSCFISLNKPMTHGLLSLIPPADSINTVVVEEANKPPTLIDLHSTNPCVSLSPSVCHSLPVHLETPLSDTATQMFPLPVLHSLDRFILQPLFVPLSPHHFFCFPSPTL